MKKADVKLGTIYAVKVSGRIAPVKLLSESPYGGWIGLNVHTNRQIRVHSAQKLRREIVKNVPARNTEVHVHDWIEQPGEPPKDICFSCGAVRY